MKRLKKYKGWGIFELSAAEQADYNFSHAVITPETMECYGTSGLLASDTDMELCSLEEAIDWIDNYRES